MIDFFLNLVKVNEGINYTFIISLIAGYLFLLWFVVCLWVFFDTRKRYHSIFISFIYMLFVLLFGPPGLILYILMRPEHTLEEDYYINLALSGEKELKPILFDGDKGFDIQINLSVEPKQMPDDKHKLAMNIGWMPHVHEEKKVVMKTKKERMMIKNLRSKLLSLFDEFGKSLHKLTPKKPQLPEKKVEVKVEGEKKEGKKEQKVVDSGKKEKKETKEVKEEHKEKEQKNK
jgi:hypothetical protein